MCIYIVFVCVYIYSMYVYIYIYIYIYIYLVHTLNLHSKWKITMNHWMLGQKIYLTVNTIGHGTKSKTSGKHTPWLRRLRVKKTSHFEVPKADPYYLDVHLNELRSHHFGHWQSSPTSRSNLLGSRFGR